MFGSSDADEPDDIYDSDEDKAVRAVLARVVRCVEVPATAQQCGDVLHLQVRCTA